MTSSRLWPVAFIAFSVFACGGKEESKNNKLDVRQTPQGPQKIGFRSENPGVSFDYIDILAVSASDAPGEHRISLSRTAQSLPAMEVVHYENFAGGKIKALDDLEFHLGQAFPKASWIRQKKWPKADGFQNGTNK